MPEAVATPAATIAAPATPAAPAKTVTPAIPVFTEQTYDETGVKATETPAEGGDPAQKPAEQAPAAPAEGERPTDDSPEQRSGKSRYERRIDKAYRRAAEAQARAEFLEKQLAAAQPPT